MCQDFRMKKICQVRYEFFFLKGLIGHEINELKKKTLPSCGKLMGLESNRIF